MDHIKGFWAPSITYTWTCPMTQSLNHQRNQLKISLYFFLIILIVLWLRKISVTSIKSKKPGRASPRTEHRKWSAELNIKSSGVFTAFENIPCHLLINGRADDGQGAGSSATGRLILPHPPPWTTLSQVLITSHRDRRKSPSTAFLQLSPSGPEPSEIRFPEALCRPRHHCADMSPLCSVAPLLVRLTSDPI